MQPFNPTAVYSVLKPDSFVSETNSFVVAAFYRKLKVKAFAPWFHLWSKSVQGAQLLPGDFVAASALEKLCVTNLEKLFRDETTYGLLKNFKLFQKTML